MDWSILIPLALYIAGAVHHWRATIVYRKWQDAVDHNQRLMAALAEAMALQEYGAREEAIELMRSVAEK
jgi:hypothetical protein